MLAGGPAPEGWAPEKPFDDLKPGPVSGVQSVDTYVHLSLLQWPHMGGGVVGRVPHGFLPIVSVAASVQAQEGGARFDHVGGEQSGPRRGSGLGVHLHICPDIWKRSLSCN